MSLRSLLPLLLTAWVAPASAIDNLHDALPQDTAAYLRLSGSGDFVGPAPGTPLEQAMIAGDLGDRGHRLAPTLASQLAADPELEQATPWVGLLAQLRGPVEVVALMPEGSPANMATLLLRAGAGVDSVSGLNMLIDSWAEQNPLLEVTEMLTEGGVGRLTYGGAVPLFYSFDADQQVVYVLSGLMAQAAQLPEIIAGLKPSPDHPMYAVEAQLDTTGEGLLLWVDAVRLSAAMATAGPGGESPFPGMMALPPGTIGSMALGWGARDGKGRLGLVVDVPRGGMAAMLPQVQNQFDLSARGQPWMFASINLPIQQMLRTVEGFLQMNPEAYADYQINKTAFAESFGLDYDQLAATLGPELLFFGDDAGEFAAIRVGDQDALQVLLDKLGQVDGLVYETHEIEGVVYHHVAYTSFEALTAKAQMNATPEDDEDRFTNALNRLNSKVKSHLYWVQEGNYLVFAQVPQVLMDRNASSETTDVGDWLRGQQGQDPANALMLFSVRMDDVPRRAYYAWLQTLLWASDIIGEPMNLFTETPVSQLSLPDSGSYGFQFDVGDPYLSLELSFDFSPVDFLLARGGMFTAAVLGAAVAIATEHDADGELLEGEVIEENGADCGELQDQDQDQERPEPDR